MNLDEFGDFEFKIDMAWILAQDWNLVKKGRMQGSCKAYQGCFPMIWACMGYYPLRPREVTSCYIISAKRVVLCNAQ